MKPKKNAPFNAQAFLDSTGVARKSVEYRRGEVIFTQGDPCEHVLYIQKGNVKLSVLSKAGREAVVAMLGAGEFFGEGCLAGQPVRMGSASATADSTILLDRQAADGATPPQTACAVGSVHRAHAGAKHPD